MKPTLIAAIGMATGTGRSLAWPGSGRPEFWFLGASSWISAWFGMILIYDEYYDDDDDDDDDDMIWYDMIWYDMIWYKKQM